MPLRARALPVLSQPQPLPSPRRSLCVHLLRWSIVGLLIATLRYADQRRRTVQRNLPVRVAELPTTELKRWFGPEAIHQELDAATGQRMVRTADDQTVGRLLSTLPQSSDISGYRGPSNVLIGIDSQRRIVGTKLLSSQDTLDHVEAIQNAPAFFEQFKGRDRAAMSQELDVVSGATLTSLAIRDSIAVRLGAAVAISSRFPEPLRPHEVHSLFPEAAKVEIDDEGIARIYSDEGSLLGTSLRSGLLEDHVNGYQGPTELLLAFGADRKLREVRVRKSFDNQPYVSYLDDEPWFWDPLRGMTWQQLAAADLSALRVEGVSGATMTSMAAAETLVSAARQQQQAELESARDAQRRSIRWSPKEVATLVILGGSIVLMWTRLRGFRTVRFGWQWVLVIGLGLLTGNLLSIALLMGWSASGVAWVLAPGLAAVFVASLWFAATSKSPFYCAQVCPHGALQQQLRGRLPASLRWHPSAWQNAVLQQLPVVLLVAAYWLTLTGSDVNLARWEPFDAYLWWTGAGGSLLLAIGSLVLSAFSPMGYCRFGCPTGKLLLYLRWHRRAGVWTRGDWLAVGLCVASWAYLAHKNSG